MATQFQGLLPWNTPRRSQLLSSIISHREDHGDALIRILDTHLSVAMLPSNVIGPILFLSAGQMIGAAPH
jgi:hypothetical protein